MQRIYASTRDSIHCTHKYACVSEVMSTLQVANLSELLREVQMLRVTREVQAVISAANPGSGRAAAGVTTAAFQPASQQLQTLENLMKHNDRCLFLAC